MIINSLVAGSNNLNLMVNNSCSFALISSS
uniref:Uncharacterized protein n=1 Tax=Tetranychus urticae TaxID=32264 RepID=T1JU28_TETUR